MIHEQVVNAVSETETANTRKDRRKKNRKSKIVIETMENGGQIEGTQLIGGDQNLADH